MSSVGLGRRPVPFYGRQNLDGESDSLNLSGLPFQLDDVVWNDFGRQDDHIVPGTEGDDWMAPADRRRKGPRDLTTTGLAVLKAGGNQGTNKVELSAAQGWSGVAIEDVDGTKQAIILSRIDDAGVPRLPAKLSAGHVSPISPVELTAGVVGSIRPGRGQSVKDEMKDETLYSSGQIYDDEDPAVVSFSCHFSLNEVGPADGDVELFEGGEEDCNPRGIGWNHIRPRQRDASLRFVHSLVETSIMVLLWNAMYQGTSSVEAWLLTLP